MMRRVQIGIAGLMGVLLLVGLTNLVIENMRKEAAINPAAVPMPQAANASTAEAEAALSEPLADLGVTPAPDVAPPVIQPPAVPDLQPDPQLRKPMDRDPRQ